MDDYISRQAAIDACFDGWNNAADDCARNIKHLPAADVVPVVRCDDCKYYGSRRWCELHSSIFDDNAFCSYGERKE